MDKLALSLKTICLVSILSGVLSAVIPKGRMKAAYLSFSAVVLISAMLVPLKNLSEKDFSLFTSDNFQISESLSCEVRTAEVMLYERVVADAIAHSLGEKGMSVAVSAEGEAEGEEIRIVRLNVKGDFTSEQKEDITVMLKNSFPYSEIVLTEE